MQVSTTIIINRLQTTGQVGMQMSPNDVHRETSNCVIVWMSAKQIDTRHKCRWIVTSFVTLHLQLSEKIAPCGGRHHLATRRRRCCCWWATIWAFIEAKSGSQTTRRKRIRRRRIFFHLLTVARRSTRSTSGSCCCWLPHTHRWISVCWEQ